MSKSAYVLELSVEPGGARRSDIFVYNDLAHIRKCVEQEFQCDDTARRSMNAYLAMWYGETMALWIVQNGAITKGIDLHGLVRARVQGAEPIRLDDADALAPILDELVQEAFGGELEVEFHLDWDELAKTAPALEGDRLAPGETMKLERGAPALETTRSCLRDVDEVRYGYSDLEAGEDAPEYFVDPHPR